VGRLSVHAQQPDGGMFPAAGTVSSLTARTVPDHI
jgi:hypothetical protein